MRVRGFSGWIVIACVPAVFCLASVCSADVAIRVERNEADEATPEFRFEQIGPPAAEPTMRGAKLGLIDGRAEPGSGGIRGLMGPELPTEADQPDRNFFFGRDTDGGRIRIELAGPTEIRQIRSYSWHPGPRAAQVYTLYAARGDEKRFDPAPHRPVDPTEVGWTLLASVDTRKIAELKTGGQYAVLISDEARGGLGRWRYFLLDVHRTEADDPFGNTFFSRIDLVTPELLTKMGPTTRPAESGKYQIVINDDEVPEMDPWVKQIRPVLEKWYPMLVKDLPSDGFDAPHRLSVTFRKDKPGVADTAGTRINCAARWFIEHPDDEGAIVHELVHVVQQYKGRGNPGWLVEGIADYYRWFKYEPARRRPHPNLSEHKYTDSYQVTATFLNRVAERHGEKVIVALNAAMRQGKYSADLWKELTGKTIDALWTEAADSKGNSEKKE